MGPSIRDYSTWNPEPRKDVLMNEFDNYLMIIGLGWNGFDPFGHIANNEQNILEAIQNGEGPHKINPLDIEDFAYKNRL
jgi:hypothetical protein